MGLNLHNLVKEIATAPRISGTEGEEKALRLLEGYVKEIGFPVKQERFSFQASIPHEGCLQVRDKRYTVLPVGYSKSGEVRGKISFIEGLESALLEGYGDCIVVYPDYIYKRSEYESLLSIDVSGVLFGLGDRLADIPTYTMFWEKWLESGRLVAATIDKQSLYEIKNSDEATLVSMSEEKLAQSANLVWDLGVDGDEDVYIFAHHDSVPYSWGVTDNACGVAVLLGVCELLNKEHLKRNVIFATFGAEELKGAAGGSREFLKKRLNEVEARGALAINIDVQGHKLGLSRACCNAKWLVDTLNELKCVSKYPITAEVRCVGLLDSFFFQRYVPTITFQRTGYYSHSSLGNTFRIVDYESIERTARAIKELVLEVDKKEMRREINEKEIEREMKNYLEFDIYDL